MVYNLGLSLDGRIVAASATSGCGGAVSLTMEMPEAFALDDAFEWRIVDGVAVYDPLPVEVTAPEEPVDVAALQAEIAELREALDMILSGVTE